MNNFSRVNTAYGILDGVRRAPEFQGTGVPRGMRELKQQLAGALLMILTVAAVVAAAINFQQQGKFHLPDDGTTWLDQATDGKGTVERPVAVHVTKGSPAEKAGIHEGDVVLSI